MNSSLLDGSPGKMRVKVVHRKMFPVLMYAVSCDGATAVWLLQAETTGQCAMVPGPVHRHNFSHTRCAASGGSRQEMLLLTPYPYPCSILSLFAFNVINIVHEYLYI